MLNKSYIDFLNTTLKKASVIANNYFGKTTTKLKADNSVVTEADIEVGKYIIQEVEKFYPDYNIINEETGGTDKNSQFTFVIDPIDGTSNFSVGLPQYGIMVGLLKGDKPIAGGISIPFYKQIYLAEKGKGTTCNGKKVAVSKEKELSKVLIAYGFSPKAVHLSQAKAYANYLVKLITQVRNLRSSNSAYDCVQAAQGKYGIYINTAGKIWDNIAPHILIEEAGGIYTDFYGKPMDYSNPLAKLSKEYPVCSGAPILHQKIQKIINS